ncbi:hypothetical protein KFE25_006629 [Diacronema lutheri]|uniref:superoxide dismutase n=1 Tax=Diacronema lutheri TaxID=2081491 RepID=A0A8J5XSB1_DIALT|nr:hypothetical protein KFE25_006629 [Diacronema lutheri]
MSKVVLASLIVAGASALQMPTSRAASSRVSPVADAAAKLGRRGMLAGVASALIAAPALAEYTLPDLPYDYEALEPYIDAATMRFHHDKHHATYVANVNKALEGKPAKSILELQKDAISAGGAVRNSGGGHYNHALFWEEMGPATGKGPTGALAAKIDEAFGSFDKFKEEFSAKSAGRFGSGWCWLGVKPDGKLAIDTTPNQDNPLMDGGCETKMVPILGLDVWEHAYYLKYQNRRPEYISSWFNVVNWEKVAFNYEKYASKGQGVPF